MERKQGCMIDRNTILVVDDNPDDVMLTVRAFEEILVPSELIVMESGIKALEYLIEEEKRADGMHPALVLLDLHMPGADGLEVLRRIRTEVCTRALPVVMMTSSRDVKDRAAAYQLGANGYLRKPVEFQRMVELAQALANYWLVMNQPDDADEGA
jgi:CheY-like chemotaxis protein